MISEYYDIIIYEKDLCGHEKFLEFEIKRDG